MKKVFAVIGRDFATFQMGIKFSLADETGDLMIFGFTLRPDESYSQIPFESGQISKLQLNELRAFIDEALSEIEKEEKENDGKNV